MDECQCAVCRAYESGRSAERARLREKVEEVCSRYYVECCEGFDAIRALLSEDAQ